MQNQSYKEQQSVKLRQIKAIQYSQSRRNSNLLAKKGKLSETATLNINLKTINKNLLFSIQDLGEDEKHIVNQYLQGKANFSTTRKLFGADQSSKAHFKILNYLLDFYQNPKFVKQILTNQKMNFQNKIIAFKFMQKVRQSAIRPKSHKLWKERF